LEAIPTGLTTPLAYRIRNFKHQKADKFIESLENHFFKARGHGDHIHPSLFDGKTELPLVEQEWSALKEWLTENHTTASSNDKLKRLQHFYGLLAEKDLTLLMHKADPAISALAKNNPRGWQQLTQWLHANPNATTEVAAAQLKSIVPTLYSTTLSILLNDALTHKAKLSLTARDALGDVIGAVSGVLVGIFGGAVVSNAINSGLSAAFGLPKTHNMTGLFSKVHNHHGQASDGDGVGAGALGTRGIHWWDAGMHLDDLPTALYMAGMHVIESAIQLLYGMSGFMTGNAGTDYTRSHEHSHPHSLTPQQIAARFQQLSR